MIKGWLAAERRHQPVLRRAIGVLGLLSLALPTSARADRDSAFCELTPCLAGPITRRTLTKRTKLGRLWCKAKQDAGVDAQGRLAFCTTARAQDLDGLKLAAGAYTLVHPNGRIYQTHLRVAQTFTLADASGVACAADLVALTPAGALTYCELAVARAVAPGVRARAGAGIGFDPRGRVSSATLDAATTLAGLALPAGTYVRWDLGGAIAGGRLDAPTPLQGLTIQGGFTLHPNGQLRDVALAAAATVHGTALPAAAQLELRRDGTLAAAEYVEDRGFMPHGEMWTDTARVRYDATGQVVSKTTEHWQAATAPPKFRR